MPIIEQEIVFGKEPTVKKNIVLEKDVVFEEPPFKAKHPNLYGLWGATKETGKALVPYLKYVDPEERERFLKLTKQKQVRELLLQNLEAVGMAATAPISKGLKTIFAAKLPKTFATMQKVNRFGKEAPIKAPVVEPVIEPKVATEGAVDETLPKYAGSVNLEKQNISAGAKQLEIEAAEGFTKKVQTWEETNTLAAEMAPEYEKVLAKAKTGSGLNTEEIQVARQVNVAKATELKQLAESGAPKEQFDAAFKEYSENIFKTVSEASSEAGRALNIHKQQVSVGQMTKGMANLKRNLNEREFKEFLALDLENPTQVKVFTERLGDPKMMDYVYEYWYNSILSGIPTHVVNVASNTLWSSFQVPHRLIEGGIDAAISKLTGAPRTRFINETIPYLAGMKTGAKRGAKSAWDMLRFGRVEEFETKWAQEIGSSLGAFDRSPNMAVRATGKVITIPTKALRAMDVSANAIGYDAELNAIARQLSNAKKLTGTARDVFEKKWLEKVPDWAHKKAIENGKYVTFMSDPGWFSQAIMGVRNKVPGGRFIIPFVNTIGNLTKRGVEMTPGLGLLTTRGQTPANIIAKQIEGSIVSLYMLAKCDAGEVTGAAPAGESEREAFYREGKQPWAIRFGDKWVSYRRVEPFNTILASTAIAYDRIKNAKDEETATEIFVNMANDLKNNLIDSSYMQGITQVLNRHGKSKGAVQRLGSSLVPYSGFFRSINRSYEAATEGQAKVRESNSWLGAFSQTIPFMEKPPAKLNVWGEEITFEGGMFRQWLPYKWSSQTTDKTELALKKLDIYPGLPSQTVTIKGKKERLDDETYRNECVFFGSRAKKKLDVFINSEPFQRALKKEENYPKLIRMINSRLDYDRNLARRKAVMEFRKREK